MDVAEGNNHVRKPATAVPLPPGAVAYSILASEALTAEASDAYGIDAMAPCRLLRRGLHDTYLLPGRHRCYILRAYRARWRSSQEIAYELALLNHLAAKDVSVAVPIAARDGRLQLPLEAPEGMRFIVLFAYAPGAALAWSDPRCCFGAGRTLATIHAASDDYSSLCSRSALDAAHLVEAPLAALQPFLANLPKERAIVEDLAARLQERLAAVASARFDSGVCHGDFSSNNIHVSTDGRWTVFDFDRCGPGWRALDMGRMWWVACRNPERWDAFVDGYSSIRPLRRDELAMVPVFQAARHFCDFGLLAQNSHEWGTHRLTDNVIDEWIASFRSWKFEEAVAT
jgi:Ser/Thr protein kinase RdoA (MazF antagonist)